MHGVLGAAEPGLDHGEAGLHEEDERAAEDHEEEVQRRLDVTEFGGELAGRRFAGGGGSHVAGAAGRAAGGVAGQGETREEERDDDGHRESGERRLQQRGAGP